MQITLHTIHLRRGEFILTGEGRFDEGVHLIWGQVGAGKSTLALLIAGLLSPLRGEIEREGISTSRLSFQFPEYHLTARTLDDEICSWGGDPDRVLTKVGLAGRGRDNPLILSRGELKRLELWCALEGAPDLLLLDEPFTSLDCSIRRLFLKELGNRRRGITVLLTHDQGLLPHIDYLWEIQEGFLQGRGKVPEALRRWSTPPPYLQELLDRGIVPTNLSMEALKEAGCRTEG